MINIKKEIQKKKTWIIASDASPWGIGILDITNLKIYQIQFPTELQSIKRAAAVKEQIGYYVANILGEGKAEILGDNQGSMRSINHKGIVKNKDMRDLFDGENIVNIKWVSGKDRRMEIPDIVSRDSEMVQVWYAKENYMKIINKGDITRLGCGMDKEGEGIIIRIKEKEHHIKLKETMKKERFFDEVGEDEVEKKTRKTDISKVFKKFANN